MYYIYILTNYTKTTLYIGVTNNLERRILEHKEGIIKGFTQKYKLFNLVYYEQFSNILDAIYREKTLKRWKRSWKDELISNSNPEWKDLDQDL